MSTAGTRQYTILSCFNVEWMSLWSPSVHQLCMQLEGGNLSAHLDPGLQFMHSAVQQARKTWNVHCSRRRVFYKLMSYPLRWQKWSESFGLLGGHCQNNVCVNGAAGKVGWRSFCITTQSLCSRGYCIHVRTSFVFHTLVMDPILKPWPISPFWCADFDLKRFWLSRWCFEERVSSTFFKLSVTDHPFKEAMLSFKPHHPQFH